jgi:hypothetical protein
MTWTQMIISRMIAWVIVVNEYPISCYGTRQTQAIMRAQ